MNEESLRNALRRAAHAIQGMYVGHGHKGVAGEAVIALATANAKPGQAWGDATAAAQREIADEWPNSQ